MTVRKRAIIAGTLGIVLFAVIGVSFDVLQGDTIRHSAWEMAQALGFCGGIAVVMWLVISWVLSGDSA